MDAFDKKNPKWAGLLDFAIEYGENAIQTSYRAHFVKRCENMLANIPLSKDHPENSELWAHDVLLKEKISEGGMGFIYKGLQQSLQREVAIKTSREERRLFFLSEAQITGKLDHANIIPVHYLVQDKTGDMHLVMKMVKGHSWRELLHTKKGENLSLLDHIRILLAVCHAVAYAHKQGIIHRDIKPENVMVGEFGQVFLMDWGLAVALDSELCKNSPIMHVSEVSIAAGTPGYMSPELAEGRGEDQNERTDIYLLGCCLHEILTKSCRHQGDTMYEILQSIVLSEAYNYASDIPTELAGICNRATAHNPQERYHNVTKFREALEDYLEHYQANILIDKAKKLMESLQKMTEECASLREVYRTYAEIRFALRHALEIWKDVEVAKKDLEKSAYIMLAYALQQKDLSLCLLLMEECEDNDLRTQVDELEQAQKSKEKELKKLRATVRSYNWREISPSLGNIFIFSGILGGAGNFISRYFLENVATFYSIWVIFILMVGVFAFFQLKGRRISRSAISFQMFGMWGIIAIHCMFVGLINHILDLDKLRLIGCSALMISIGMFTTALKTNYWLIIPGLLFMLCGALCSYFPMHSLEIFGTCWFVCLTIIGLVFKRVGKK